MLAISTLYFPVGVAIGVAAAAPVGPVNLLVIQRTLSRHAGSALVLGAAAAIGDCLFAVVAAFGLGAVDILFDTHVALIRIVGGAIMLAFAVIVWRAAPHLDGPRPASPTPRLALLTWSMTVTNPATMFFFLGSFGAIGFTGIGHDSGMHRFNAALLVIGVFTGSMLWWLLVTALAGRLRGRIADRHLALLNHVTAAVLAIFGTGAIIAGVTAS